MARWFFVVVVFILLAGCSMKRNCITDAQGRKMCEEWQATAPNITVIVPVEEPYGYGYRHYCDDPYDPRCKVQLGGGGPSVGFYGGGVHTYGDPHRGVIRDYYYNPLTGKQEYGPVGGYGGRRGGRWWHRRRKGRRSRLLKTRASTDRAFSIF